jgi:Zn-dependent protease with chaperone function
MKREKYEQIADKAEQLYRQHPALYKTLLVSMAFFGYAYILFILLLALALFILLLAAALSGHFSTPVVFLGILIWLLLRALWIKLPPPFGLCIAKNDAHELVSMIEQVCTELQAPAVSEIVLTGAFNAGVSQLPRLGIFGWHKNYLAIGLPLLFSVSPEQFKAVLAHEFGHLYGSHAKFGIWIYRIDRTWQQVIHNFSARRSAAVFIFLPFYKWFVPRFSAFAHVQNRRHEFEADRFSVHIAGKDNTVAALIRIHFFGELFDEKFWSDIYKLADSQTSLPSPYEKMPGFVENFNDYTVADFAIRRALRHTSEGADTHPALAERISAIVGCSPDTDSAKEQFVQTCFLKRQNAFDFFFGDRAQKIISDIDGLWKKAVKSDWEQRHVFMKKQHDELSALETKAASQKLNAEESSQLAHLTETILGPQKALPLYQQIVASHPDNMPALFAVGRLLLQNKDDAGLPLIEQVMEKVPSSRLSGCQLLAKFHYDLGDLEKSQSWRFKMEDEYGTKADADYERAHITVRDKFLPHDLSQDTLSKLCAQLSDVTTTIRVCLVKKVVKNLPDEPCYVLLVQRVVPWWRWSESRSAAKKNQELLKELFEKVNVPLHTYVFVVSGRELYKKIKKVPSALVFSNIK